jgi:hypothetical protein
MTQRWDTEEWVPDEEFRDALAVVPLFTPLQCLDALQTWCDSARDTDCVDRDSMQMYLDAFQRTYTALEAASLASPHSLTHWLWLAGQTR